MAQSAEDASQNDQSPVEAKYAPTTWGTQELLHDLTCPSGQTCQVLRPGVEGLLEAGILHNLDVMTAMVQEFTKGTKGRPTPRDRRKKGDAPVGDGEIDMEKVLKKPEVIVDIMKIVDKAIVFCVKQPKVEPKVDVEDRKEGHIYTDMIDINDRMYIFNFIMGGSANADQFREGLEGVVGGLDALSEISNKAQ